MAFTARTPIRSNDSAAVAEVLAANTDFEAARAAGLPAGDQPWAYYEKGYTNELLEAAQTYGWSDAEVQASIDRVADDMYVSENWDGLVARGVDIFSLPGSHDWVAYDVPGTSTILPDLRTYIVPNGGHGRPVVVDDASVGTILAGRRIRPYLVACSPRYCRCGRILRHRLCGWRPRQGPYCAATAQTRGAGERRTAKSFGISE